MKEDSCVFSRATTHQRGHTCWFDTAIVTLANTRSMRILQDNRPNIGIAAFKKTISDEIATHGGLSEFSDRLQKTISIALGEDACPMKPTSGQDMFLFLKNLLDLTNIESISMKVPSVGNTPTRIEGNGDITCSIIHEINIDIFIEERLPRDINKGGHVRDSGVLMVQCRGGDGSCFKLDCSQSLTINTPYGSYDLKLTSMAVSAHGHVMSFGKCGSSTQWVVFDNEFTGVGYSPRTFSAENFGLVKDQMYRFPHTYFDPKHGPIQMNPFFKQGIRSSTVFVYDFVRFED